MLPEQWETPPRYSGAMWPPSRERGTGDGRPIIRAVGAVMAVELAPILVYWVAISAWVRRPIGVNSDRQLSKSDAGVRGSSGATPGARR